MTEENGGPSEVAKEALGEVRRQMNRRPTHSGGTLVAEGDSWFSLPGSDVLEELEDLGYDIESLAHPGDTVESMAYSNGQLKKLARLLNRLATKSRVPRSILLSGGGNDIAGDGLAFLLNHRDSRLGTLNHSMVKELIDVRLYSAYDRWVSVVDELNAALFGQTIRVVVHGYDYAVPDGRGFLGGWWVLPGPWLKPAFDKKGYNTLAQNRDTVGQVIDCFNEMLERLATNKASVRYVDLRGTLRDVPPHHKRDWRDELHPREKAFESIAARIAEAVEDD